MGLTVLVSPPPPPPTPPDRKSLAPSLMRPFFRHDNSRYQRLAGIQEDKEPPKSSVSDSLPSTNHMTLSVADLGGIQGCGRTPL